MENKEYSTLLFDDNLLLFSAMIEDILAAKKYIYIETYRFADDSIGKRFKEALITQAKKGLEVKLLLDAYGTKPNHEFFEGFEKAGIKVFFFKKLKFFISNTFAKNHTRNHRKLLLIDDEITYIGSSNLTSYSLSWREVNLRIVSPITRKFRGSFLENLKNKKIYDKVPFERIRPIYYHNYTILQDTPSAYFQTVKKEILKQIALAKEEIIIETPYFLPGSRIKKSLVQAVQRGVKVRVLLPLNSDVPIVDLLRNTFTGQMYRQGVEWFFYKPDNLHAKCLLFDRKKYMIGSSNMDYRSFRYQYEIMMMGQDTVGIGLIYNHLQQTLEKSIGFDYNSWLDTPWLYKFAAWLLSPLQIKRIHHVEKCIYRPYLIVNVYIYQPWIIIVLRA